MSLVTSLLDWFKDHDEVLGWLIGASILMLVISVAAVGWVIIRVPADYFAKEDPEEGQWAHRHPLIRFALIAGKNLLGLVLVAAGILMLVLRDKAFSPSSPVSSYSTSRADIASSCGSCGADQC